MKTTTENSSSQQTNQHSKNATEVTTMQTILTSKPSRSVRPMKSMVRARSLKPQRIEISTKLRRKPIKA